MKNFQLFTPNNCPDAHLQELVRRYALRDAFDGVGWCDREVLEQQYRIYQAWLEWARGAPLSLGCEFYEWMLRDADYAFVLRPGDLVKCGDSYCVVTGRQRPGCKTRWRMEGSEAVAEDVPDQARCINVKFAGGKVSTVNVENDSLKPADIPPEVFALACGKAKDCPMMKGE